MSTNSDTVFSVTDDGRPTETPRCTRTSLCSREGCLVCEELTSDHHVRNLNNDLEVTPNPKPSSKPPAPPNHILYTLTEEFKQALIDEQEEDIKALLTQYDLFGITSPDFLTFDRTELVKLVRTARELHKGRVAPQPNPHHPPPPFQTCLQYEDKQTGNSNLVR